MSYNFYEIEGGHLQRPQLPLKPSQPDKEFNSTNVMAWGVELAQYETAMQGYLEADKKYRAELGRLMNQFEQQLQKDFDLAPHVFDMLWAEAYDRGHSGGVEDVYAHFVELHRLCEAYKNLTT